MDTKRKIKVFKGGRWVDASTLIGKAVGTPVRLFEPYGAEVEGSPFVIKEDPFLNEDGVEVFLCDFYVKGRSV